MNLSLHEVISCSSWFFLSCWKFWLINKLVRSGSCKFSPISFYRPMNHNQFTQEKFWGKNTQWMQIYCYKLLYSFRNNCYIWTICNYMYLPTIMISNSEACFLILVQISMANIVLLLLKMEVREDMRAAIITASIIPRAPVDRSNRLWSYIGWMSYIT